MYVCRPLETIPTILYFKIAYSCVGRKRVALLEVIHIASLILMPDGKVRLTNLQLLN